MCKIVSRKRSSMETSSCSLAYHTFINTYNLSWQKWHIRQIESFRSTDSEIELTFWNVQTSDYSATWWENRCVGLKRYTVNVWSVVSFCLQQHIVLVYSIICMEGYFILISQHLQGASIHLSIFIQKNNLFNSARTNTSVSMCCPQVPPHCYPSIHFQ